MRETGCAYDRGFAYCWRDSPSGAADINPPAIQLRSRVATVRALGRFVEYDVPEITIQSGDFVVGFVASSTPETFPMAFDITASLKRRSYVSTNGSTFALMETFRGVIPGNFLIRAEVE